jgi:LCP family protein required for cell wall assembly
MARRARVLLFGAVLAVAGLLAAWQVEVVRHGSAQSLRMVIGAPEPPPPLVSAPLVAIPDAAIDEPPPDPLPTPQRPAGLESVSFVLLLGADNRDDKVVGRTDAMIVAGFRHRDGKIAAFSLPRDLWVGVPDVGDLHAQGHDHARLSSIVRVGEVRLGKGLGMPLLRQTLLEQFGVRIDRFASIDFAGFVGLIDQLGGVDVDVPCPIRDCFWTNGMDQPCVMLDVAPGRVHMDGATALGYVRSRHGSGDRDRTRRQQALMLALAHEARASGLRGLPGLWRAAEPWVDSDLALDDAIYYASFALETELSDIGGFAITHPMTSKHVTEDGKHVMLLDRAAFDAALAKMFDAELPALRERKHCAATAL